MWVEDTSEDQEEEDDDKKPEVEDKKKGFFEQDFENLHIARRAKLDKLRSPYISLEDMKKEIEYQELIENIFRVEIKEDLVRGPRELDEFEEKQVFDKV